jgi:hypothetical protein
MTEKEAIIILTYYNDWRMGEDIEMPSPKLLTEAINIIIYEYYKKTKTKHMETTIKNELIATMLLKVIEENELSQDSAEETTWKIGYKEACDMMIEFLNELK